MARMNMNIRRNDLVQVVLGEDSGMRAGAEEKRGVRARVLRVLPGAHKVVVEGVNVVRRATRPNPQKGQRGGFNEKEMAVDVSNVMLVCRNCDRPVRVSVKRDGKKKMRCCKKCGEEI